MNNRISYIDGYGRSRIVFPVAEFTDEDGNRFFVVPAGRGTYDVSPPYGVIQYREGVEIYIGDRWVPFPQD